MLFYYREPELNVLNSNYSQVDSSARMVVLTARRRIGKTLLALKHVEDKPYLYLFVAKKNERLLCDEFLKQIQATFPDVPIIGEIKDFKNIFQLLLEIAKKQQFVLIIDEFQEFININPSVFSDIQQFWDLAKFEAKIQVLFLGSVYSLIHKIFEDSKEPLFGRADYVLHLKPFAIIDIYRILNDYEHANIETVFNYYLFTGGVPKYVDMLISHRVFSEDEIINFALSSESPLIDEGKTMLIEEFGKEYTIYFAILELLALGKTGRGEIESILQKDIGGYLDRLDNTYNVIKKKNPFDAKPNTKLQKYGINDQFLQYWFRYIYRHRTAVEMGNFNYIKKIIARDSSTYKGRVLEQFFYDLLADSHQFNKIGTYWNRSGTDEIDLVAVNDLEKKMLIIEIKLNKAKISLTKLEHKAQNLIKPYHDYDIEYLALSLDDAKAYIEQLSLKNIII